MVISRYLRLSVAVAFSFILGIDCHGIQFQGMGDPSLSYASAPDQSMLTIEPYQHTRDYHDLYRLFNANYNNLGMWGYDDTFPQGNQIKVARLDNRFAGFVIYMQQENKGFINYVAVDQKMRNNGLGKILLKDAINDLKQQGVDSVSLKVYEHNTKAQSLYERLGFYLQSASDGLLRNYALSFA